MKKNDFNELLKQNKDNLQRIIYKHINGEIYLTSKQVNEVLKKRDKKKE